MRKWGAVLFMAFESKVSRREDGCLFGGWVSLRCGDADRFFDGVVFGGYVVGEVTEVHVSNIVVGIDFDGFDFGIFCSNFCSCGRFLKE